MDHMLSREAWEADIAVMRAADLEAKLRRFAPIPVRRGWLRPDPAAPPVTFSPRIDAAIERARDAVADVLDTLAERFARDRRTGLTIAQGRFLTDALPRLRGRTGEVA